MKKIRDSDSAWSLLERLVVTESNLVQCSDPTCFRFHISTNGVLGRKVRESTLKTLVEIGLVLRARTTNPAYVVSEKGLRELQRYYRRREFEATRTTPDANPQPCPPAH